MKTNKFLLAIGIAIFSFQSSAQNYLGVHASNYAGVMGTDNQPASFVDGRFKVDINLGSFNFGAWTNAGAFDTKGMPKWWVKSFKSDVAADPAAGIAGEDNPYNNWMDPDSTFSDRFLIRNYQDINSKKTFGIYNNIQVDVLNFMFHIKPTIAVGFTAKVRSITNVDNVDPKLALLAENGLDYSLLWNQQFNEELLTLNHLTWAEYGVNYAQVLKQDGEHFMKMGGKVKWLSGYTAAYANTENFIYELQNKDTSLRLSGDFSYGHSKGILGGDEINGFPKSASKFGLGLDLGFVYEWRPDWKDYKYDMDGETNIWRRSQEKYTLKAGVSILDIGGMKFEKGDLSRNFNVNSANAFDLNTFDRANSIASFDSIIDSLIMHDPAWTSNEDDGTFFMYTPTSLSLQLDYHIWKWFYVNLTGNISVQSKKKEHRVHVPNQISLTPSFDYVWFGLHVPLSYNCYSGFKAGLGARLGPLTVGLTDFRTLFASGKINGTEVYAGLRLPINYTEPDDTDEDLVSDKKDECPSVKGLWAFRGCPDTDGDGIQDTKDDCPSEAGLAVFNGCPDKDGDSIPDKDDACPELSGDIAFQGCPDRDNDSIIDPKDDCPDTPGLAKFNGCPDTDGDGIKDEDDACPDVAGPIENNGCPDTDGDGLFDFIDDCPTVAGPKENNGCPWPDTDGDGLLDKDDKCPYLAGPINNEGCPYQDTDNDGVLDKDDKCPNTPGPISNQGCPEIEKEVQEILKTAFDNLEFETGKDVIKQESIQSLGELAEVLVKKSEWKLQIAGHTDNVGNDQGNLILSKKRAESVKAFMVSRGINPDRLTALYFGETEPIGDNGTPEGRQKNRRVEMTIVFE
jgi:outer membrane protein OmpA-like peptidoglycan-associated protein